MIISDFTQEFKMRIIFACMVEIRSESPLIYAHFTLISMY